MPQDPDKAQAVAFARRELEGLDERIAALLAERKSVAGYLARLTGEQVPSIPEGELPTAERAHANSSQVAAPNAAAFTPAFEGDKAYHSRAFNKRAVNEAIDMILAAGRPLSAPEIIQEHSARSLLPTEMLYRLMYNRVVSGVLMTIDGAFWPEGKELPPGYDIASAKRSGRIAAEK
jgi:hypothetical protein